MNGQMFKKIKDGINVNRGARRKMDELKHIRAGNLHMKVGEFKQAKNCYVKALEINNKSVAALYKLAKTYLDRGKLTPTVWKKKYFFKKGIKYTKLAIAACKDQPAMQSNRYVLYAEFLENLGEYYRAILQYKTAIKLHKQFKIKYEKEIKRLQDIVATKKRGKENINTDSGIFTGNAYKKAAEVYYQDKKYKQAKECCKKAINANPTLADELNEMLEEIEKKLKKKPRIVGEPKKAKKGPRIVEPKEEPTIDWAESDARYDLLRIRSGASAEDVKKAFWRIVQEMRPDNFSHDDPDYEERVLEFVKITEAKESILNEF